MQSCTGVPDALTTATYDAANQQLTLGPKSETYDHNGNLQTLTDSSAKRGQVLQSSTSFFSFCRWLF
ncbi:MAG: hypothetical protein HOP18_27020 [Deltaproteobacteria bacterium]|nr:hypothetical protein [Deltaproteobacteria bacterium]